MALRIIIAVSIAYLLGSIPFAYIAAKHRKGVDIREIGGGNMGALNVMREIGPLAGYMVWAGDIGKGILSVLLARWLGIPMEWVLVAGFAAVLGHNFPMYLNFRGGKGGASIMGVMLALVPLEFLSGFAITALFVLFTSNPALGLGVGMAFLPLFIWWYDGSGLLIGYAIFMFLFMAARFIIAGLKKANDDPGIKKNLVFNREYNFWQTKKENPSEK